MNNPLFDDLIISLKTSLIEESKKEPKSISGINEDVSLYLLYHTPKYGSDTYLLTSSPKWSDFEISFSHKEIKAKAELGLPPILKEDEVNKIANYALANHDVQNLLEEIKSSEYFQKYKTKNELLKTLIGLFNTFNYKELEKLRSERIDEKFQKIIKVLLFSIPQFSVDEKYATTATNNNLKFKYVKSSEKNNKYELLFNDFQQGHLNFKPSERIFLLITYIEGYLWKTDNNNGLGNFYVGNLYEIIIQNISPKNSNYELYTSYSFYLSPFDFYIYGDIKYEPKCEEKLHKVVANVFRSHFDKIIQFVKSFISKINIDSVSSWYELSNPISTDSIAHGIMNICLPQKIGCFEVYWEDNMRKIRPISSLFELNNKSEILERLENLWGCYKETDPFIDINNFPEGDKNLLPNNNQLLIKTENAFSQTRYIAVEFNQADFSFKNILPQVEMFKYTFKAFLDKLELIHQTASLNLNNRWYKKAYCSLYEAADKVRLDQQYKKNCEDYRSWEEKKLNDFFSGIKEKNSVIIYDFGAFNGRLTKKILDKGGDKIKRIYAIDQNQKYITKLRTNLNLLSIQSNDDKIQTISCDFRNIHLFLKNNEEKADLIFFANTVFGCFDEDLENKIVLETAYDLLKPHGILWVDQFNPLTPPKHCTLEKIEKSNLDYIPIFKFDVKENMADHKYMLIKTSNIKKPSIDSNCHLYYGNYMYFKIENSAEKLIKCDTYEIKLYSKEWFDSLYPQTTIEMHDEGTTVLFQITKAPSKIDITEAWDKLVKDIEKSYHRSYDLLHPNFQDQLNKHNPSEYLSIYNKICELHARCLKLSGTIKFKNVITEYEKFKL